jgi:hypothetical protein
LLSLGNARANDKPQVAASEKQQDKQEELIQSSLSEPPESESWKFLHSYDADYEVLSGNDALGSATRKMSIVDGQWLLETKADISKYFINLNSNESTKFRIIDNLLQTDWFYSKTKVTFKKVRRIEQSFDWKNSLETGSKGKRKWQLQHSELVFDRISHIVQLREDLILGKKNFSYRVSYKGKVHDYKYTLEKVEKINTAMGALDAIKLVRNKSNGDVFTLWLSPELNYIPVQIAQVEQDKPDVTLLLKSLTYTQQPPLPAGN